MWSNAMTSAARLSTSLRLASNELFADATRRPRTSAESVATIPIASFTVSLESSLK